MSKFDIVRAWKDATYRHNLSGEEQALLPEHPAGSIDLTDEELPQVAGATGIGGCGTNSFDSACFVCPVTTLEVD